MESGDFEVHFPDDSRVHFDSAKKEWSCHSENTSEAREKYFQQSRVFQAKCLAFEQAEIAAGGEFPLVMATHSSHKEIERKEPQKTTINEKTTRSSQKSGLWRICKAIYAK